MLLSENRLGPSGHGSRRGAAAALCVIGAVVSPDTTLQTKQQPDLEAKGQEYLGQVTFIECFAVNNRPSIARMVRHFDSNLLTTSAA